MAGSEAEAMDNAHYTGATPSQVRSEVNVGRRKHDFHHDNMIDSQTESSQPATSPGFDIHMAVIIICLTLCTFLFTSCLHYDNMIDSQIELSQLATSPGFDVRMAVIICLTLHTFLFTSCLLEATICALPFNLRLVFFIATKYTQEAKKILGK